MPGTAEVKPTPRLPRFDRWRRHLASLPPPVAEESLLLRILAQALVLVGIGATDVAAETSMSAWAIPLSIAGAWWSWRNRHKRNITAKFLIALGMLLAMAAFFVGLRAELNDTRLVLAELLVQLQVLHSFDLPRRKDLGYSMVIGLILIGVASTLSQTMTFGLLLLLFLAIALPVLVLDYRSRLGLIGSWRSGFRQAGLAPRRLATFLVVILVLGLALFAVMPRLPGYRIRTFPVSAQIQQVFDDNTRITNPGYVRARDGNGGSGARGQGERMGPGELDKEFYYGFSDQINQNLRGELTPKVVLRVRSQAEGYWRVLSFDQYIGQGWKISRNEKTQTVRRPGWSYQFFLPRPISFNRTKEVVQTYTVVSELPNLIPSLPQARELFFPTPQIAIDPEDNLRSPLGLLEGLTYTVISDVPYRNRTLLRNAPTAYPRTIRNYYLDVPAAIQAKVRQRTEALLATSPQPITSPYEKALFLAQALKQRYTIQTELPFLAKGEDLVDAFLFKYQGGYPDHFSTALTIMLRSIGIPARLTVGFGPGEFNPFTGLYVVKNTDAYAVTEVFFPRYGWFMFDPIPGHELIPPSIEEDQTFSVLQQFWQWVAGWLPSPVRNTLGRIVSTVVTWVMGIVAWFLALFTQGWLGLFASLIAATLLGFAGWLSWQGWKQWRQYRWLAKLPPMERLYQQMLRWLARQGFPKQPTQTPLEYAHTMHTSQDSSHADAINEISQAYVRWRYGGQDPDIKQLQTYLRNLQQRQRR